MPKNKNPGAGVTAHGANDVDAGKRPIPSPSRADRMASISTVVRMTRRRHKAELKSEQLERTPPADRFSQIPTRKKIMLQTNKPKLATTSEPQDELPAPMSIAKPPTFNVDKFKTTRAATIAGVETLQTALPVHKISAAKDFVRLHPDEDNYWSQELCFCSVPIKGQKTETLNLIEETLAMTHLPSALILRFRLALASKPWDTFFLCQVPTTNLDNTWNVSNVMACANAKARWVLATSRKGEGVDGYKIDFAKDEGAFAEPSWPARSLSELIAVTFAGRMIDRDDHPNLLRLIGAAVGA
jgi:hypothetical protein